MNKFFQPKLDPHTIKGDKRKPGYEIFFCFQRGNLPPLKAFSKPADFQHINLLRVRYRSGSVVRA